MMIHLVKFSSTAVGTEGTVIVKYTRTVTAVFKEKKNVHKGIKECEGGVGCGLRKNAPMTK